MAYIIGYNYTLFNSKMKKLILHMLKGETFESPLAPDTFLSITD